MVEEERESFYMWKVGMELVRSMHGYLYCYLAELWIQKGTLDPQIIKIFRENAKLDSFLFYVILNSN